MTELPTLLAWFGVVLGMASVAVSLILYKRSGVTPEPVYVLSGRPLAASNVTRGIGVNYKGEAVDAVQQLLIVFWNAGRGVARGTDVPEHSPLRFEMPQEARILEATVAKYSNADNQFSCSVEDDERTLRIEFHHLGERDGGLVEVLHTGVAAAPRFAGTVVGAKAVSEIRTPLWDDPGGHRPLFVVRLLASVASTLLGAAAILAGSVDLAWWALGSLALAAWGHLQARSSFRQDIRYLPELIRPPPYNRLQMSRRVAGRGADAADE